MGTITLISFDNKIKFNFNPIALVNVHNLRGTTTPSRAMSKVVRKIECLVKRGKYNLI